MKRMILRMAALVAPMVLSIAMGMAVGCADDHRGRGHDRRDGDRTIIIEKDRDRDRH